MEKQALKHTQNHKMQVGFTNEAGTLLHAPLHQKQAPLEQTPAASLVFV